MTERRLQESEILPVDEKIGLVPPRIAPGDAVVTLHEDRAAEPTAEVGRGELELIATVARALEQRQPETGRGAVGEEAEWQRPERSFGSESEIDRVGEVRLLELGQEQDEPGRVLATDEDIHSAAVQSIFPD